MRPESLWTTALTDRCLGLSQPFLLRNIFLLSICYRAFTMQNPGPETWMSSSICLYYYQQQHTQWMPQGMCTALLILSSCLPTSATLHGATSPIFLPPLPREPDTKWGQCGPSAQEGAKKNKKAKLHKSVALNNHSYAFCFEHLFHICVMVPLQWKKPVILLRLSHTGLTSDSLLCSSHRFYILSWLLFAILNISKHFVPAPCGGPDGVS